MAPAKNDMLAIPVIKPYTCRPFSKIIVDMAMDQLTSAILHCLEHCSTSGSF